MRHDGKRNCASLQVQRLVVPVDCEFPLFRRRRCAKNNPAEIIEMSDSDADEKTWFVSENLLVHLLEA